MIKFFRKIRQELLLEGKTTKYFKYAIGEISLVVIGILIALQFNNSNEQRKNLKLVKETIDGLETELLENYYEANSALDFWRMQDSISKKVLYDQLTEHDYKANDLISILTVNWNNFLPKTESLDLLIDLEKSSSKNLRPVISAAKRLKERQIFLERQWTFLRKNIDETTKALIKKVSLVRFDSISENDKIKYMLHDPEYKSTVELSWIYAEVYSDFVSRYRAETMALLSTIKIVRENYDKKELELLYVTHGMRPFLPSNCSQQQIEKNNELRRVYLVGNMSDKPIRLNIINDGKIGGILSLQPKQFKHTKTEYAGIEGDYTVFAEQTDNNGNCIQKFIAVNKGYLLIE